jgi:excinuclease ABC subunit C
MDEAHRVAIGFHRKRRTSRSRTSALDAIPGLGPSKAKALLKHFGSVTRIRSASMADLMAVPGIGPVLAAQVHEALTTSSSVSSLESSEETDG